MAFEKRNRWRYSVICTNIPDAGVTGTTGSHHPQFIDTLHREHTGVETVGVRTPGTPCTTQPGAKRT
jgi:hypothetical protein